ncbi:hypothetical protein JXQ31_06720 [candidate division KSB1 bacterium]|nr:hypothetical protein [candidate division KSB1 bacterium]
MRSAKFIFPALLIFLICFYASAETENYRPDKMIKIDNMGKDTWKMQAFSIDKEIKIKINAKGMATGDNWRAKAWIINAATRSPVWEMTFDNTKKISSKGTRQFNGDIILPAGQYEVYYGIDLSAKAESRGISGFVNDLFHGMDYYDRETRDWGIELGPYPEDDFLFFQDSPVEEKNVVVKMTNLGHNENQTTGFSINKDLTVRIYMIGEGITKNKQMYDYGWITDADTRERVWEAIPRLSYPAGGAIKNRLIDTEITLPPGNYLVHYITDDSHSAERFNQMPPYDPQNWGITIFAVYDDFQETIIKEYIEEKKEPIIKITRTGNDVYICEGFELLKASKIEINALGEYSKLTDRFVDYGWIIDARTREKIWTMDLNNTKHAGGSEKNKMADEIIELQPAAYKVFYITDDSHAFDDWNSNPPPVPENWGITIWPADKDFDLENIRPYNEKEDQTILASLIKVENSEHRRKSFKIEKPAEIRIYALGEGDKSQMYDYGWIENKQGKIIWLMEYADTEHAGGAQKNRLLNKTIELDAGEYTVHYETDDSHSYNSWNSDRPDDFQYWGIMILLNKIYQE